MTDHELGPDRRSNSWLPDGAADTVRSAGEKRVSSSTGMDIPRWWIRPEPSDEELVAIMTALTIALRTPVLGSLALQPSTWSRWAHAGRIAALAPWPPDTGLDWSRRRR